MDFIGKKVMVLDGEGRQIASIVQELHRLGCISTTVNSSKLDVGYTSRYPNEKLIYKEMHSNPEAFEKYILSLLKTGKYDVVIPVQEESTEMLLKHQEELKEQVRIVCAPYDAFVQAYDKQKTMELCMKNNIPCPITKTDDETLDEYLAKIQFPLAVKPRKGTGSIGFRCVKTKDELLALIADGTVIPEQYIIQEYIPQTAGQYSVYMFFDDNHKCCSCIVAEHCRWFPMDGGAGCFIRTVDDKQMADDSIKMMSEMGWSGYCQSGIIRDPRDGKAKVLEVNGRIPAGIKICQISGHNIVEMMLQRAYGVQVTDYGYRGIEGTCLQYSQTDMLCCLHTKKWWKSDPRFFFNPHTKDYIFSLTDPIPYFSYSIQHLLSYRKEMAKRKH